MRTIAVANQKGGCGKTTTCVNLAAALAKVGKRVLLIDLDSQGHATLAFGIEPGSLDKSIYEVLTRNDVFIKQAINQTELPGLDVIGSNILLSGAEGELSNLYGREYILGQKLRHVGSDYDICLIDCSPSLSVLTLNALVASTDVIIPVQTHYYALEGLKQLLETIDIVKSRFNPSLSILGVLMTFMEKRVRLSKDVYNQMVDYFGDLVFDTVIHRNVRLAEAPSAGESVITYAPKSNGALEYLRLAEEIANEKEIRITKEDLVNI